MKNSLLFVSIFSVVSIVTARELLPSFLKKCSLSDPNLDTCYAKQLNDVIPFTVKGDKKFHFPSLLPLKLNEISIESGDSLKINLKNVEIFGLEHTRITKLHIDPKANYNLTIHASLPKIEIKGDYQVKGKILIVALEDTGPATFTFTNGSFVINLEMDEYKKNQENYLKARDIAVDFNVTYGQFHLENLFNGNKQLSDETNKVFNENWQVLIEEFKPAITKTIQQIMGVILNGFFSQVPVTEIFEP